MKIILRQVQTRLQLRKYSTLVRQSGLFDDSYYLSQNPDVAEAGIDPIRHYFIRGAYEGRDPYPLFDSSYYLSQNRDVAASKLNPLVHYIMYGRAEGRSPHPSFGTGESGFLFKPS